MGLKSIPIISVALACMGSAAHGEPPSFLADRIYASKPEMCGDTTGNQNWSLLTREGLLGGLTSCQFLGFDAQNDPDTGVSINAIARATCTDDGGGNRPDLLLLTPMENSVRVQSQNEFQSLSPSAGDSLSGDYIACD